MGKIREQRLRNKRRKVYTSVAIGVPIILGICIGFMVWINSIEVRAEAQPELVAPINGRAGFQMHGVDKMIIPEKEYELDSLQIVMVGDMLMHEPIIKSGLQEDGSYNFDHLFANVKDTIEGADLAIANQETIMGGSSFGYTGYPSFNTPYALADAEANAGFDVLLFATNHAMDKGAKAIFNCMDYMEEEHPEMEYLGINRNQEAQNENIYVFEDKGMKIAILNYTYGTNGISLPSDKQYLVNLMKEQKIRSDIQKAEEIADFTIVCPHWGVEYNLGTSESQEKWANIFLEEGVDLVIGAHPHVIEPVKWLTREDGHQMLVYYSLGNFVNGTSSTGHGVTNRMVGGIADVTLMRNASGKVEIHEYDAIEIVCHMGKGSDYTVYYMDDYTEKMASENLILKQDREFSKALCESVFDQVWGE